MLTINKTFQKHREFENKLLKKCDPNYRAYRVTKMRIPFALRQFPALNYEMQIAMLYEYRNWDTRVIFSKNKKYLIIASLVRKISV